MEQVNGNAFFLDKENVALEDFSEGSELLRKVLAGFSQDDLRGQKILIARANFGEGLGEKEAEAFLKSDVSGIVAQSFDKNFFAVVLKKGIAAIEMGKKEISDIFESFADKDATAAISKSDDGFVKLKLISGSFSKSYKFREE